MTINAREMMDAWEVDSVDLLRWRRAEYLRPISTSRGMSDFANRTIYPDWCGRMVGLLKKYRTPFATGGSAHGAERMLLWHVAKALAAHPEAFGFFIPDNDFLRIVPLNQPEDIPHHHYEISATVVCPPWMPFSVIPPHARTATSS
jgi:hypothetical protein